MRTQARGQMKMSSLMTDHYCIGLIHRPSPDVGLGDECGLYLLAQEILPLVREFG